MIIKVYAYTSPENMIAAAEDAGLTEQAADYFRYFYEVVLELDVEQNGTVTGAKVLNQF
jgi:hypothetical protein